LIGFFETQTFKSETVLRVACCEFCFNRVVGEDDDFNARSEQSRDNVALQEIDDCHAVVGGDEDTFGH